MGGVLGINLAAYSYMVAKGYDAAGATFKEGRATIIVPSEYGDGVIDPLLRKVALPYPVEGRYTSLTRPGLSIFPAHIMTDLSFDSGVLNMRMSVKSILGEHDFYCAAKYQIEGHMFSLEQITVVPYCPLQICLVDSEKESISLLRPDKSVLVLRKNDK